MVTLPLGVSVRFEMLHPKQYYTKYYSKQCDNSPEANGTAQLRT
jgi:hypothetical protein